jgi:Big-like domain-containing protein/fibronectin type III domain protein
MRLPLFWITAIARDFMSRSARVRDQPAARQRRAARRTRRPLVEPLEDRRLLAIAYDDFYSMYSGATLTYDPTSNDLLRSWSSEGGGDADGYYSVEDDPRADMGLPWTYTPDPTFVGTISLTYSIYDEPGGHFAEYDEDGNPIGESWESYDNDGTYGWSTATVTIDVTNTAPIAPDSSVVTDVDSTLNGNVGASDSEGVPITCAVVTDVVHGDLSLASDGSFVYVPAPGYHGTDGFQYSASDSNDTAVGTVSIAVNASPAIVDDSYTVLSGQTLSDNVLGNDTDPDGDALAASLVSSPSHGTLSFSDDGSFVYQPDIGYMGLDSFTYAASDGIAYATGTVTINVAYSGPTADDDSYMVNPGSTLAVEAPGVLANDLSATGGTLTVVGINGASSGTAGQAVATAHGTVTLASDGSFIYSPADNYYGIDSFTYENNDGSDFSSFAIVSINVNAFAIDDSFVVAENNLLSVDAPGILTNDTDENIHALMVVSVAGLSSRTVGDPLATAHGTVTLNVDGSVNYEPDDDYYGPDAFTYRASDGNAESNNGTVSIMINGSPVATPASFVVTGAGNFLLTPYAADPEGDALTFIQMSGASHGVPTIYADGFVTYTPNTGFYGNDQFTYRVTDGHSFSNVATVSVRSNNAPVPGDDTFYVNAGHTLSLTAPGLLTNDIDPDSDHLTVAYVQGTGNWTAAGTSVVSTHGSVTVSATGSFSYTPTAGFHGTDTFKYTATDGSAYRVATATIHVNGVPVASDDAYSVVENGTLEIYAPGVLANDHDPENDALAVISVHGITGPGVIGQPIATEHGSVTINADGSFDYTPAAGFYGDDVFTYQTTDGNALSNVATAMVHVVPLAPTGLTATASTGNSVTLHWSDMGSEISYVIQRSNDNASWATIASTAANTTTYTDTGLTEVTLYYYRVIAHIAIADSAPSTSISRSTVLNPPATATAVSDTEIDLTWPSVTGATGYKVERMTNVSPWTQIATPTTNSFDDTGLSEGHAYYYHVLSTQGDWELSSTLVYAITLPTAPTGLAATFANGGQADLTWTDQSSIEIGYSVEQWIDGDWQQVESIAPGTGTMNASVMGVFDSSTAYSFRVRAYENDFTSNPLYSQPSSDTETTAAAWPAAPTDLVATAISDTEIDLAWTAATGATDYKIERSADGLTGWTQISTATNAYYDDTTVTQGEGTLYYYRARATNGADSGYTEIVSVTTLLAAPAITASSIVDGSTLNLTWDDNSSIETGYSIEQLQADGITWQEVQTADAGAGTGSMTVAVSGPFNPSTIYHFRLKAFDANLDIYSASSNEATATALGWPAAPTDLTTNVVSNTEIDLAWIDDATNEDGYTVELTTDGVNWSLLTGTPLAANTQSYQITGLTDGTLYGYRVQAFNVTGGSGYAFNVDATLPTAPADLQASVVSGTEIDLSWTAAPYATGYTIWKRAELESDWQLVDDTVPSSQTTYAVIGLAAGGVYYEFCVAPTNSTAGSAARPSHLILRQYCKGLV